MRPASTVGAATLAIGGSTYRYGYHFSFNAERLSNFKVLSSTDLTAHPDGSGGTADYYQQAWEVDVTFNRSHATFPASNGPDVEEYVVARNRTDQRWRIVDSGCC